MKKWKGSAYVIVSSVVFGLSPIYMKVAADFGLGVVAFTLWRSLLITLGCLVVCRVKKIRLRPPLGRLKSLLTVAFFGSALTNFLLSLSYNWLPSGVATSLHFVYPALVMLVCVLFLNERPSAAKIAALALGVAAVACMAGPGAKVAPQGVLLALASGGSYAFYVVYLSRSGAATVHPVVLLFYSSLAAVFTSLPYGLATGTLPLQALPAQAVVILLVSTPISAALGIPLFQLGLREIGETAASILSTLEPATALLLGVLLLGETLSPQAAIGCLLILLSSLLVVRASSKLPGRVGALGKAAKRLH